MDLAAPSPIRRRAGGIRKRYRALRRQRHERRFKPRWRSGHYGGFRLNVYLADTTGERWYGRDWPEFPESTLLLRSRLRPGSTVFDLGAHHGVVALVLAKQVEPSGSIVAVEGSKSNADIALLNAEHNEAANLSVVH